MHPDRRRPIPISGSEFVIPADTLIAAVAQAPEISFLTESHGLSITASRNLWGGSAHSGHESDRGSSQEEMRREGPGYLFKPSPTADGCAFHRSIYQAG